MPLPGSAVDITVSNDGQYTFVLTSAGEVAIYRGTGDLVQPLKVGKGFDSVQYSSAGNRLILGGSGKQQLKIRHQAGGQQRGTHVAAVSEFEHCGNKADDNRSVQLVGMVMGGVIEVAHHEAEIDR